LELAAQAAAVTELITQLQAALELRTQAAVVVAVVSKIQTRATAAMADQV
jgi:hypothetical protein